MKIAPAKLALDGNILALINDIVKEQNQHQLMDSAHKALEMATGYQGNNLQILTQDNILSYFIYLFPKAYLAGKTLFGSFAKSRRAKDLSILEPGCGLAPATFAILNSINISRFEKIHIYLNDMEKPVLEFAEKLLRKTFPSRKIKIKLLEGSFDNHISGITSPFDIIFLSFSLEELAGTSVDTSLELIVRLRQLLKNNGRIFITQPADKARSTTIMYMRNHIPEYILAPCTHNQMCPLLREDSWCHFTYPWSKPPVLQNIFYKLGCDLPDIKFSYLVISKKKVAKFPTSARIITPIHDQKGKVEFKICGTQGISNCMVLKRDMQDRDLTYKQNGLIDLEGKDEKYPKFKIL